MGTKIHGNETMGKLNDHSARRGQIKTKPTSHKQQRVPFLKGFLNEGQDMEMEHFPTILKMVKCCHVRSVVVNSLIYLDAKRDGTVITPLHLRAETQPLSCKRR